jgi:hypothetical protein
MIGLWFWADDYSDIGIPLRWEWATPNIESSGIWWDWGRTGGEQGWDQDGRATPPALFALHRAYERERLTRRLRSQPEQFGKSRHGDSLR